jgi:hypothetical protein
MRQNPPNARLWIRGPAGDVKLTLRPGERRTFSHYEDTDEGYRHTVTAYDYLAGEVRREIEDTSRDCDGTHYRDRAATCPIADLRKNYVEEYHYATRHPNSPITSVDVTYWPAWQRA